MYEPNLGCRELELGHLNKAGRGLVHATRIISIKLQFLLDIRRNTFAYTCVQFYSLIYYLFHSDYPNMQVNKQD